MAAAATERDETTRRLADANRRIADLNGQVGILLPEVARLHQLTGKEEGTDRGLTDAHRQIASLTGAVGQRDQEIDRLRSALQEADQKKMVQAEKDLVKSLQPEIRSGNVTVHHSGDKLIINLAPALLFEKGKDRLNPAGADALTRVAGVLKEFPEKPVQVSGHTDNLPIRGALAKLFPTNKELSLARAQQAAKILTESGVSSSNISQNGYAETQPVADNMTEAGRQKNRRVEILVTF
ncbi:MAG: hypothetical protein E8D45_07285 [Nitrospira sp.]|nr:MAG: hypothetical protein E8D45_07285 [Nitrospira sp.]